VQATVSTVERDPSGILFHDLMVNMLGSFLMGNIASFREELQVSLSLFPLSALTVRDDCPL
jgi:hypothetical protein